MPERIVSPPDPAPRDRVEIHWYWQEVQTADPASFPTVEPPHPEPGAAWYNPALSCLCVWDGVEWACVPLD